MLPVVIGPRRAARWGLLHVLLTVAVSLVLVWVGSFGAVYLVTALFTGSLFTSTAAWLTLRPHVRAARLHFQASIVYLSLLFAGMILDVYLQHL